jgi:hypothetical protein
MQSSTATRRLDVSPGRVVLAVLLGATAGVFISGYWLLDYFPAHSRQLLFVTGLLAAGSAIAHYALAGTVGRRLTTMGWSQRTLTAVLGLLLGVFLFFAGTRQWQRPGRYVAFLLPRHQFRLVGEGSPAGTALVWLSTSLGDTSYDSLVPEGWQRQGDEFILQDPIANSLKWSAVTGERLQIVLENGQPRGRMRLTWDGGERLIQLVARKTTYEQVFAIPFYASGTFVILLGLVNFVILSFGLLLIGRDSLATWLPPVDQAAGRQGAIPSARGEVLIVVLMAALAVLLRAFNLGVAYPAVDEYYHLIAAKQILGGAPLASVYERGLWVVTLPVALALRVLGHEVWAARAIGILFNSLAVVPLYLLTRKISRPIAVVACFLYASSPWIITFGRVAREYAYYPFYFYWIIYAMVSLLESIPKDCVVREQWRMLLRPRVIGLLGLLAFPPVFALYIDWLSTFRTILIAYLVFGLFVMARFDWRARWNWPFLAAVTMIVILVGRSFYLEQITKLLLVPRVNIVPLEYFFPNPQQQWYYERLAILVAAGMALAIGGSIAVRRMNSMPLFFVTLFLSYLGVFALISKSFFHTRHLISTQFWYLVVIAMGLSWLWDAICRVIPRRSLVASALIGMTIGAAVLNTRQITLPSTSRNPDMPISEDYMHDMSEVQAYLVGQVQHDDVLIATVYGLYATWEGEPRFGVQYRINSLSTKAEIESIVDQYASGWIVIDSIRLDLSQLSMGDITNIPQMEYIGLFGDEHVWRWQRSAACRACLPRASMI